MNIKINARKTEAIVFTKFCRTLEAPIKIRNGTISYSLSVKYFGLTLDSKLIFIIHITKTINKACGALSILNPLFKSYTLSKRIIVILYMAIIRSMLLYGCEAWSILAQRHKKRVQILHNKCLKIIFYAPRYTRILSSMTWLKYPILQNYWMIIPVNENPLVQAMEHFNQRRAKHRNIFLGVQPDNTGII